MPAIIGKNLNLTSRSNLLIQACECNGDFATAAQIIP
jgi:hypothetical protein